MVSTGKVPDPGGIAMTGRLQRLLSRHCSAAAMDRLVDPILTDIRIEAAEARLQGRWWASFWIRCAGVAALIRALAIYGGIQFWRFQEWPTDDRRVVVRTLAYAGVVTAAAIALLTLPVFIRFPTRVLERASWSFLLLHVLRIVSEALFVALPVGFFIGLIYGFRAQIVSLRPRATLMVAALLCSAASLAWVEYASPTERRTTPVSF